MRRPGADQLVEIRRVGVVVERAGDENVEVRVAGLAGRGHEVWPRHGSELGPDEDGRALLERLVAFGVPTVGEDVRTRPGRDGVEDDSVILVSLLDA